MKRACLRRPLAGLFAVSVIGAIFGTAAAPASAGWSAPVVLANLPFGPMFWQPHVATNAGDAVLGWNQGSYEHEDLRVTVRRNGGAWERPSSLRSRHLLLEEPRVAMDRQGTATVAWSEITQAGHEMEAATRTRRGRWGPPVRLTPGSLRGDGTEMALDPHGRPVVLMERVTGRREALLLSTRASDGRWRGPRVVAHGIFDELQFAIDAHGEAIIAWHDDEERVSVLMLGPDGRPERPALALPRALPRVRGCILFGVQLATDARGDAVVGWGEELPAELSSRNCGPAEVATRIAGAAFSRPVALRGASSEDPEVAVDSGGAATALFSEETGKAPSVVEASSHPLRGRWSPGLRLSPAGVSAGEARIASDGHSGLVAVWTTTKPPYSAPEHVALEASALPVGLPWQPPSHIVLRGNLTDLDLALAPNGRATAVWVNEDVLNQKPSFLESADYVP